MSQPIIEEVLAVQNRMIESASSLFLESELDHLRCLVRLTVEFLYFVRGDDVLPAVPDKLRYLCESVFSGLESFALVSAAYRVLQGAEPTTLAWYGLSVDSLKREFVLQYENFSREHTFERRCRLLLDMFKLQIVFAGVSY